MIVGLNLMHAKKLLKIQKIQGIRNYSLEKIEQYMAYNIISTTSDLMPQLLRKMMTPKRCYFSNYL